jgi:capsular polysaccharide biosynthesis protein
VGKKNVMPEHVSWSDDRVADDEPVDLPRHLAALKRNWPLIALIVLSLTGAVLALSIALPKTYQATARIVMADDSAGSLQATDVETVKRRLATVRTLLTTRAVLADAAHRLSGASADSLKDHVHSSVNRDANIIDITADDGDPKGAAAIANAVALSFLEMQRMQERRLLDRARAQLTSTIQQLRGTPGSTEELRALRARLSELSVSRATVGTDLELAQQAQAPSGPASPRPVRNTVFAFFAAGFIAFLAALGIDQVAPRLSGARELSRLARVPILATVPRRRGRSSRREPDEETFGALEASLATQLPAAHNVVLIASAFRRDGKFDLTADLTARLAWTLARARYRTLLVCADVRDSRADDALGVARAPGFTDVLGAMSADASTATNAGRRVEGAGPVDALIDEAITTLRAPDDRLELDVLPAGGSGSSRLLANESCATLFDRLRRSDHRFVVVDGPPLLGTIEGQLLTRYVDAVVVVCRVDRMSPTSAAELGDLLAELPAPVLGAIAVGCDDVIPHVLTTRTDRVTASRSGTRTRTSSAN